MEAFADGLSVSGIVHSAAPQLAAGPDDLLASDHIEIWVADAQPAPMPPVGFGNQFGDVFLASAADCDKAVEEDKRPQCRAWFAEQKHYRALLRRAFVRQWVISGSTVAGMFASPAIAELPSGAGQLLSSTTLRASTELLYEPAPGQQKPTVAGTRFHVFIPWAALPPVSAQNLDSLHVLVSAFAHAPDGKRMGAMTSIAPNARWGEPQTFPLVHLAQAHRFEISPCHNPLQQPPHDPDAPAPDPIWLLPPAESVPAVNTGDLDSPPPAHFARELVLENQIQGYLYAPDLPSPQVTVDATSWKRLSGGGFLCVDGRDGKLSMRRRGKTVAFDISVNPSVMDVLPLSNGWLLVRNGPTWDTLSPLGTGACGACPRAVLQIWAISPEGKLSRALSIDDQAEEPGAPDENDLLLSKDWRKATLFRRFSKDDGSEDWSAHDFCLQGHTYTTCGERKHIPAPPVYVPALRALD